jgi:hypothetical protein
MSLPPANRGSSDKMAIGQKGAEFLILSRLRDAEGGDVNALFELGVTYSTDAPGARPAGPKSASR